MCCSFRLMRPLSKVKTRRDSSFAMYITIVKYSVADQHSVADPENFGGGDDKIYKHGFSIGLISKFRMFMINLLDVAEICLAYF